MEWVEVQGKSVDVAVQAALDELGLSSADEVTVEIIQEPKAGFLGLGGLEAVVKVSPKPKPRRRRRRRTKSDSGKAASGGGKSTGNRSGNNRSGGNNRSSSGNQGGRSRSDKKKPAADGADKMAKASNETKGAAKSDQPERDRPEPAPIEDQAVVAKDFLGGVLEAFGLDGKVTTRIDDDILYVDVSGDQTEALIGNKGSVMHALHELTRTVVQRKTFGAPRMRIDVAGYTERRREALRIYTGKLADRVVAEGGEVMLEPMNAADRKVVHDTVAEIAGIRSFSEGEEPRRAVVLASETPPPAPVDDAGEDVASGDAGEGSGEDAGGEGADNNDSENDTVE